MPAASSVHEFGPFRLDPAERLLLRAGQPVALTPKAFDVLLHLVERHGRLLTKQELMSAVWPDTFVEEANLTYTVSALRKALGDGQNGEHLIQTVPTRGYRFVAPVALVAPAGDEPVSSAVEAPRRVLSFPVRRIAITGLAVVVIALLSVAADRRLRQTSDPPVLARFTIPVPQAALNSVSWPMSQVSPDGRRVAFSLSSGSVIWLREIAGEVARPIRSTEGAQALFWAPDSQQFGFTSESALKTLSLADGSVQTLCDTCEPTGGGTWSRAGTIVFTTRDGPLLGIPAAGGTPRAVTSLDRSRGEISHVYPSFLPDGIRFLYLSRNADASRTGLYIGQVGSSGRRLLLAGDVPAIYAEPGYLIFLRGGTLMAQRFDPERVTFSGEARPVVAAPRQTLLGQPGFSASTTGVLTYSLLDRPLMQFQWMGRGGAVIDLVGEPGAYYTFDLSPDASRLAFVRFETRQDGSLWVLDLERGVPTRVTFGTSLHADPRWAAAHHLVATRWQPQPHAIVRISPDGLESTLPIAGVGMMVDDVAADGQHLLYRRQRQLLSLSLRKGSKPVLIHQPQHGSINQAQYSPDSGWIAYHSDESGRFDVYVTSASPGGTRWQVSSAGGLQPVWRQDGRELFYLALDGTLHAVAVGGGGPPQFSPPRRLFKTGLLPTPSVEQYAASRDGQQFLVLKQVDDKRLSSIGVVLGWPALLPSVR